MAMTSEQFQQMMTVMTLQQQAIKAKDEQISKVGENDVADANHN